ncbi:hypothetical protein P872_00775 [Rhodonellum psychrophilum GCM71 = DSM 17998]|uniref:NnrU domain-containing protein n=2 Tax=Rhodonellum TaxID=336827 RepID=U5BTW6_9BACT|nr:MULTISPECIES: isoprenylcysteine carboxylmethyltransferase family protein [Rhodonellum]ERM84075.1 hypothetical protein P872_00775 [Rhodonellum psychrophilum GCM71 = DSM 17998]MDO9552703.1 isoprenylcysteine carboxylmethyltransferase family protein [Rhodonellum sp.]SDY41226.1 Protein-S-isoprenylcysteine O-methyltransferase Ste14 [Rhodonellum ikkaensis]
MSHLILVVLWALFYFLHSLLASLNIKRKLQGKMGSAYKWYRLIYSFSSSILFLAIFVYAGLFESKMLLNSSPGLTYLSFLTAGLGTIILVKAFKHFQSMEFIGLAPHEDLDKKGDLIRKGIHQYVRHPIYSGLILIFLGYFFYLPTLSSMIHLVALLVYLPFGIYYEEKKLTALFGEEYKKYKEEVPALIPFKTKKAA